MLYFRLGSGNGEKNEKYICRKYNGNKNQGNEKSSRNVTGAVSGTDGNEQTDGLKMGIWCLSYNRTKLDETQ